MQVFFFALERKNRQQTRFEFDLGSLIPGSLQITVGLTKPTCSYLFSYIILHWISKASTNSKKKNETKMEFSLITGSDKFPAPLLRAVEENNSE